MAIFEGLSSALGTVLSTVGGLGQNQTAQQNAQNAQNFSAQQALQAEQFSANQFATRYQTTVADMKAAGLNPMLAYGQGGGSPPTGVSATGVAAPSADVFSGASGSGLATATVEEVRARAEAARAQADASSAQAEMTRSLIPGASELQGEQSRLAGSSADLNARQLNLVDSQVRKISAEIPKIEGDTNFEVQQQILRSTAFQVYQSGVAAQEQGMTLGQQRAVMQQTIQKLIQETDLAKLDVDAARKFDNVGREAGQLRPVVELIISAIRAGRR